MKESGYRKGKGPDEEWTRPTPECNEADGPGRVPHRRRGARSFPTVGSEGFRPREPQCWPPDVKCAHSPDRLSRRRFSRADHRPGGKLSLGTDHLDIGRQQTRQVCATRDQMTWW